MTYLSPGVYTEEVSGIDRISGVGTSTLAIVGRTAKGPVHVPRRITNAAGEYERVFGLPFDGSYTAQAVRGFFDNGGSAVFVVRADEQSVRTWNVTDSSGADPAKAAFAVEASSPGAWANDIEVAVAPDRGDGQALLPVARVTEAGNDVTITVTGTAAFGANQRIVVVGHGAANPETRTVVALTDTELTVDQPVAVQIGDRVAAVQSQNDPQFPFASGSGIHPGDVLEARVAGSALEWVVKSVAIRGRVLVVTMEANAQTVPGVAFVPKVTRLQGALDAPADEVAFGGIRFAGAKPDLPVKPEHIADQARAYAPDGAVGVRAGNAPQHVFRFPHAVAGPLDVEVIQHVFVYGDNTSTFTGAEVTGRYGFVPTGTRLQLTPEAAGVDAVVVDRTADGFVIFSGGQAGAPIDPGQQFTAAAVVFPDENDPDAQRVLVVRAIGEPAVDDWMDIAGAFYRIATARRLNGDAWAVTVEVPVDAGQAEPAFAAATGELDVNTYAPTTFETVRFALTTTHAGSTERFDGLSLDPRHPRYYAKDGIINETAAVVRVGPRPADATALSVAAMPASVAKGALGSDDPLTPEGIRRALAALEYESEPALICAPDILTFDDPTVQVGLFGSLTEHAERLGRFAVVDAPSFPGDLPPTQELVNWRKQSVNSTYAAVYAPFVRILNPVPGATTVVADVPPSGFVAGIMARVPVHRAPANQPVKGVVGLKTAFLRAHQDALNPAGVNLIRAFPGRGTLVWGARNATDDGAWRFVNVRRLALFIEHSIDVSLQTAVFAPNTRVTWQGIRISVENFLETQFLAGALAGATPDEAFDVQIGLGVTMTTTDVEEGRMITLVRLALPKPAEVLIFRFSHKRPGD